jgi:hypothetical protein
LLRSVANDLLCTLSTAREGKRERIIIRSQYRPIKWAYVHATGMASKKSTFMQVHFSVIAAVTDLTHCSGSAGLSPPSGSCFAAPQSVSALRSQPVVPSATCMSCTRQFRDGRAEEEGLYERGERQTILSTRTQKSQEKSQLSTIWVKAYAAHSAEHRAFAHRRRLLSSI